MDRVGQADELALALLGTGGAEAVRRLSALLMAAEESFWCADLRTGKVTVGRSFEIASGLRLAEIGDQLEAWRRLVHPDDLEAILRSLDEALRSSASVWTAHARMCRADGTHAPARFRAAILREADGSPALLVGSLVDLSDRASEAAELEARTTALLELTAKATDEERRRRLVARAVGEAIWEWEVGSNTVKWSDPTGRLLGYRAQAVEQTYEWWVARIHPDDREGVARSLAMHLEDDLDEGVYIYRLRCADDEYVWVRDRGILQRDEEGRPRRIVGAMRILEGSPPPLVRERRRLRLSPRQVEVLELVRAGNTNKGIAGRLGIGEQSVKDHVSRLLQRFGVPNRAALVAAAEDVEIVSE